MSKNEIVIVTDSASDIIKGDKIVVIPMVISFEGEEFRDGVDLSHEEFYKKLIESDKLPHTSQVPPYEFEKLFRQLTGEGKKVIAITMSSKLSGTYQSACVAAAEFSDSVFVIDSENVTVAEQVLILYARQLIEQGMDLAEILEKVNEKKKNIRIVALLDTLEYLKKGGRISKTAAFAGSLLSIKPVIAIENGEVVVLGKARGSKQGNNLLMEQINKAGGIDFDMPVRLGYTGLSDVLLKKYIADSEDLWKNSISELEVCTVGGTIGTHIGPGAIAVAFFCSTNS